jgi:hypothetical protein
MSDDTFLSRWAKRKAAVKQGVVVDAADVAPPLEPALDRPPSTAKAEVIASPVNGEGQGGGDVAANNTRPPPLTLEDTTHLTPQSDFTRFVAPNVDPAVKNAALKKLFADPQFNVMDGLDTYIDDYGKPDPIPMSMLRTMVQSHVLGLFAEELEAKPSPTDDQNAAVRLQPHDAPEPADPPAPVPSAEQDAGRER